MSKYKMSAVVLSLSALLVTTGCESSSGESKEEFTYSSNESNQSDILLYGAFAYGPVEGLTYRCNISQKSSTTDEKGGFECYTVDYKVSFSIGDNLIASDIAIDKNITPYTLFSSEAAVINLTRLLLTLDADGNSSNGIKLDDTTAVNISQTGKTLNFKSLSFEEDMRDNFNISLIDAYSAMLDLYDFLEYDTSNLQTYIDEAYEKLKTEPITSGNGSLTTTIFGDHMIKFNWYSSYSGYSEVLARELDEEDRKGYFITTNGGGNFELTCSYKVESIYVRFKCENSGEDYISPYTTFPTMKIDTSYKIQIAEHSAYVYPEGSTIDYSGIITQLRFNSSTGYIEFE